MMLRREKPLAVFVDAYGAFPDAMRRYLWLFDRRVAEGAFVKREYVVPDETIRPRARGWHTIMYALPEESWRIDAMIKIRLSGEWSLEHEREEGRLLGYEEWQNDAWLGRFAKN
jgi:hypothetical protein